MRIRSVLATLAMVGALSLGATSAATAAPAAHLTSADARASTSASCTGTIASTAANGRIHLSVLFTAGRPYCIGSAKVSVHELGLPKDRVLHLFITTASGTTERNHLVKYSGTLPHWISYRFIIRETFSENVTICATASNTIGHPCVTFIY
jgi:hypothetical protein